MCMLGVDEDGATPCSKRETSLGRECGGRMWITGVRIIGLCAFDGCIMDDVFWLIVWDTGRPMCANEGLCSFFE